MKIVSNSQLIQLGLRQHPHAYLAEVQEMEMGILALNWTMLADAAYLALTNRDEEAFAGLLGQLANLLFEAFDSEADLRHADPSVILAQVNAALVRNDQEATIYCLGQLRLSLYFFQTKFDAMPVPWKEQRLAGMAKHLEVNPPSAAAKTVT